MVALPLETTYFAEKCLSILDCKVHWAPFFFNSSRCCDNSWTLPVSTVFRSLIKHRAPAASSQTNKEHQRNETGPLLHLQSRLVSLGYMMLIFLHSFTFHVSKFSRNGCRQHQVSQHWNPLGLEGKQHTCPAQICLFFFLWITQPSNSGSALIAWVWPSVPHNILQTKLRWSSN